jgi:methyl-accepting chemotaxis protein
MPKLDNATIELVSIAVTALAVLLQAIVLFFIYLALRKAIGSLRGEVEDLRSSLMPMVDNSRELIDNTRRVFARVAPKAEATASDLARIARGLREQTGELETAAQEILERVRVQTNRMDAMATSGLDAVDRAGNFVAETVGKPMKQLVGLAAAAKAIIESLRAPARELRHTRSSEDEDTFV